MVKKTIIKLIPIKITFNRERNEIIVNNRKIILDRIILNPIPISRMIRKVLNKAIVMIQTLKPTIVINKSEFQKKLKLAIVPAIAKQTSTNQTPITNIRNNAIILTEFRTSYIQSAKQMLKITRPRKPLKGKVNNLLLKQPQMKIINTDGHFVVKDGAVTYKIATQRICDKGAKTIVHPIHFQRAFMRTILYNDNPKINYIVIMPKMYYEECYCAKGYVKYYLIDTSVCDFYRSLKQLLQQLKPSKVILSCNFTRSFTELIRTFGTSNIIGVPHCIFVRGLVYKNIGGWDARIPYYTSDTHMHKTLTAYANKTHKVYGIPQFDYILRNNKYINDFQNNLKKRFKTNNTTLIINGSTHAPNSKHYKYMNIYISNIIREIRTVFKDTYVFIKNKVFAEYNHTEPKVLNLKPLELTYNYLGCDLIIVIEGGTSFIEALMMTPNVILYQNINEDNRYNIVNKYNLLISKTASEFKQHLKTIAGKKVKTDITKYIQFEFGGPLEPVSGKILT